MAKLRELARPERRPGGRVPLAKHDGIGLREEMRGMQVLRHPRAGSHQEAKFSLGRSRRSAPSEGFDEESKWNQAIPSWLGRWS